MYESSNVERLVRVSADKMSHSELIIHNPYLITKGGSPLRLPPFLTSREM